MCVCVCFHNYNALCRLFGRTVLYVCIEYHIQVNMYDVSAQGVDERMINVHYYYYYYCCCYCYDDADEVATIHTVDSTRMI